MQITLIKGHLVTPVFVPQGEEEGLGLKYSSSWKYCASHVDLQGGNGIEKVVGKRSGVSLWMKLPFVHGLVGQAILHYYMSGTPYTQPKV